MAYELVNAVQLNNDLLDIADAIRGRSSGQDPLHFPNEFISEINSLPPVITGSTNVTAKAIGNIAKADTVFIVKDHQIIPDPDEPTSSVYSCAWSPNGKYFAEGIVSSPYIKVFDTTPLRPMKLEDPSTLPTGYVNGCAWSPDGTRLAVAHYSSPYVTIYDTTTTPYTKITNPSTLPAGNANYCAWSPDGTRLAVAHNSSPYVTIYDTTTTPYTKITNPSTLPAGGGNRCAWSPSGSMLAVTYTSSPYASVYDTSAVPYQRLSWPDHRIASSTGPSCAWSPDGKRLALPGTSPCIYVVGENVMGTASNKALTQQSYNCFGFAPNAISSGSLGTAVVLFEP